MTLHQRLKWMKKKNSVKPTPPWCSFSNKRSRPILEFLKLWRCRKKNVAVQEETPIHDLGIIFFYLSQNKKQKTNKKNEKKIRFFLFLSYNRFSHVQTVTLPTQLHTHSPRPLSHTNSLILTTRTTQKNFFWTHHIHTIILITHSRKNPIEERKTWGR